MPANEEDLKRRLLNARESLDTELKSWVDPSTDTGILVIAGACIALRNNDGGFLVIGIRDDGKPDDRELFQDIRATFHQDCVQGIISKYLTDQFEVTVHFIEHAGMERIVIEVPSGVRTPAFCRLNLPRLDEPGRLKGSLLRENVAYVRTLSSNGTPSTSEAQREDWPRLLEICFNNREADIGAFVRRQLSGMDVDATASAFFQILQQVKAPSAEKIADDLIESCLQHAASQVNVGFPIDTGIREVAAIISGDFDRPELDRHFMQRLNGQTPQYSGWPPWTPLMVQMGPGAKATFISEGWQAYLEDPNLQIHEFSRIEQDGKFYYLEKLHDDWHEGRQKKLDFSNEIARVAEIAVTALSFGRIFCGNEATNSMTFAIRWRGLSGRVLINPLNRLSGMYASAQDEIVTHATIPIVTPPNAITPHVEKLIKPLIRLFGGETIPSNSVQTIVSRRLNRES